MCMTTAFGCVDNPDLFGSENVGSGGNSCDTSSTGEEGQGGIIASFNPQPDPPADPEHIAESKEEILFCRDHCITCGEWVLEGGDTGDMCNQSMITSAKIFDDCRKAANCGAACSTYQPNEPMPIGCWLCALSHGCGDEWKLCIGAYDPSCALENQ